MPKLITILSTEDVIKYLNSTPMDKETIPECAPWPWFVSDKNPREVVYTSIPKVPDPKVPEDWWPLMDNYRRNPKYFWFEGSGGISWVHDSVASIISDLSHVMPNEAIAVEKKYLPKFGSRNATVNSILLHELTSIGVWTSDFSYRVPFCEGPPCDFQLGPGNIEQLVYEESVELLSTLDIKPFKSDDDYLKHVKTCVPKNPAGSVALSFVGGARLTGTKGENWPQLVSVAASKYEEWKRDKSAFNKICYNLGIALVPRTRQDGGVKKPRQLFMGPADIYPLEAVILDCLSAGFKHSFDEFGYYPFSAASFLDASSYVVSSDYHRFDQSIPTQVIRAIMRAIGDVCHVPAHIIRVLTAVLCHAPLVWASDDEVIVLDRDGSNPSGDGIFVAVNHIWAHVSQMLAYKHALKKLSLNLVARVLKFGDDVILMIRTLSKGVVDDIVREMSACFKWWGIGWKTDAITNDYACYLRNHFIRRGTAWHKVPVLSSRVRNLCCPERTEPSIWYLGKTPSWEVEANTALAMRIQFYGLNEIAAIYNVHGRVNPLWLSAAKKLDVLIGKLVKRATPYLLPDYTDEELVPSVDRELQQKYDQLSLQYFD